MFYKYYLSLLDYDKKPAFLNKYLELPSLLRLKGIGYFCGMDYASKNIYNFKERISRFDHSLSVALLIYKLTKNKKMTIAGLFHDISTPAFSHTIDYLNKDYEKQESTEANSAIILGKDYLLSKYLNEDLIDIKDIINFKRFSIVDNNRPKLCADRLDGIIITGFAWLQNLSKKDIKDILENITIYINKDNEEEIGFKNTNVAIKVSQTNNEIDKMCKTKEDYYMMALLANIILLAIKNKNLTYSDLYELTEKEIINRLKTINEPNIKNNLNVFFHLRKEEIPDIQIPKIKNRTLNPLVNNIRLKTNS